MGSTGTPGESSPSSEVHAQNQMSNADAAYIRHARFGPSDYDSFPPATAEEQRFRHSGWASDRRRVYEALGRTGTPNRVIDAFANCGSSLWLEIVDGELQLTSNQCHCRHCLPCSIAKRSRLIERLHHHVTGRESSIRFLTLTMRASPTSLADKLKRLWHCFRMLRQRQIWKAGVKGGAAFVEMKLGANSKAWHVHLHCIIEGRWIDHRDISETWHAVTGDSYVVDIRPITSAPGAAAYVAKYATKPCPNEVIRSKTHLDEMIVSTRGRRLWQCFGSWRQFGVDDDQPVKPARRRLGALEQLATAAAAGEAEAARWFAAACRKWPALERTFVNLPFEASAADPP